MEIIWAMHAKTRQKKWEKKLEITKQEVENLLSNPEQIVSGDMGVLIAQSRYRDGLLRIAFVERENKRKILTMYWTSKIKKYWKEEKNESEI